MQMFILLRWICCKMCADIYNGSTSGMRTITWFLTQKIPQVQDCCWGQKTPLHLGFHRLPDPIYQYSFDTNKKNLRDLIAATRLVLLLKLDSNRRFFDAYDLQIYWMISQYNRAPVLCNANLCASVQSHLWIQNWVVVRKHSIWVKIGDFSSRVTLIFDGWTLKTIEHLLYVTFSFVHNFLAIDEFDLSYSLETPPIFGSISVFFCPVWPGNLTDGLEKQ